MLHTVLEKTPLLRSLRRRAPVVAVVRLYGVISPQASPMRAAINLPALAGPLERAFQIKGLSAVALAINSPGGSPVQSALVHDRIRQLAAEKEVPVFAFCEDVAASGGYWIACAGDEVYANANSIVGSIGVIAATFGFEELLAKIGVERRVYTAGEKKSFLDPFQPVSEADVKRLNALQKDMHDNFKAHVRARRGERLQGTDKKLFSGEFWTGSEGLKLGLVDGIGDLRSVMRERFGDTVKLRVVQAEKGWLRRRLGMGSLGIASGAIDCSPRSLIGALEERAYWSRFGL